MRQLGTHSSHSQHRSHVSLLPRNDSMLSAHSIIIARTLCVLPLNHPQPVLIVFMPLTLTSALTYGRLEPALQPIHLMYGNAASKLYTEATAAGFEPARAKPSGFRVHLLNHSDKLPAVALSRTHVIIYSMRQLGTHSSHSQHRSHVSLLPRNDSMLSAHSIIVARTLCVLPLNHPQPVLMVFMPLTLTSAFTYSRLEPALQPIHLMYGNAASKLYTKRQLQDSNLRGQSPVDFESTSLTTRTNCLQKHVSCPHVIIYSMRQLGTHSSHSQHRSHVSLLPRNDSMLSAHSIIVAHTLCVLPLNHPQPVLMVFMPLTLTSAFTYSRLEPALQPIHLMYGNAASKLYTQSDSCRIRTCAGKAQWISSPPP